MHTKRFKANIGCLWFLSRSKVGTEEEIMGGISKDLRGLYNTFCSIIPATNFQVIYHIRNI